MPQQQLVLFKLPVDPVKLPVDFRQTLHYPSLVCAELGEFSIHAVDLFVRFGQFDVHPR